MSDGHGADTHINPVDLDLWQMSLADAQQRQRLEEHAEQCARCGRELALHREATGRFRAVVFPRTVAQVTRPRGWWRRWRRLLWSTPVVIAVTAALLLWARPRRAAIWDDGIGVKGGGDLKIFASRAGQVFAVDEGTTLLPGDAIRFFLEPNGLDWVIVASVDGAGSANIYYPYEGASSAHLDPGRRFEVPGSIVLDAAPGPERVFAIFSAQPLSSADVRAALAPIGARGGPAIRDTHALPLIGTWQTTLRFEKAGATP